MTNHKRYWDTQFSKHSHIWGETHSKSAELALSLFRQHKISKILVPGSGYGRNSKLFSTAGFDVTGIEISDAACTLAQEYDPATKVYNGSFLDDNLVRDQYEGIYCFNVLQLFLKADRIRFIDKCAQVLTPNGFMFFTAISEQDEYYGQGKEIEENTFAVKPDKILHFFTVDDLREHFAEYSILKEGNLQDQVIHDLYGLKTYQIRYIFVCN
jgi:2-polyprenyl-3-methyl-5-hydroxy-6-metoxy-1,4-benzoquinol methylase